MKKGIQAVLFDLDGTLADTAPDLGGALNQLRREEHLPEIPLATMRKAAARATNGRSGADGAMGGAHKP